MKSGLLAILILGCTTGLAAQTASADWPQWRGPNRDGSAPSFTPPAAWPESLTERWKVDVGLGYATPVVAGGRVFVFTRQSDEEVVTALDAASGEILWTARYDAPYELIQAAAVHGMGPKATPALLDGKLFTLGISGILSAFDAASGRLLWQKAAPAEGPTFSTSQSPLADSGLLIVHVGGNSQGALTAFDPETGSPRWQWNGDGPAYGSPVVAEIAGTRQVITLTYQNLVGVSVETGELLWQRPFRSRADVNALTPVVAGDMVIVSGGDAGVLALRISMQGARWAADEAWHNTETFFQFSNLVLVGDTLFGLAATERGQYVVFDVSSGRLLWRGEPRTAGNAAFQKAGNLLLVLQDDGELLVADGSNRTAFVPLHRYKVAEAATWSAPAISGNRIFVKDVSTLALWTVD